MTNVFDQFDGDTPSMVDKVRHLEGSGDSATSPKGAIGRFQIMPATAKAYGIDEKRLKNPDYAERSATRIIKDLQTQFPGDDDAVLVAYNAGPGRARQWIKSGRNNNTLPTETQNYLAHSAALDGKNPFDTFDSPAAAVKPSSTPRQNPEARNSPQGSKPISGLRQAANVYGGNLKTDYETRRNRAATDIDADVQKIMHPKPGTNPGGLMGVNYLKTAGDFLDAASAGPMALADQVIGRPANVASGGRLPVQATTDVASAVLPVLGEAGEARAVAKAAREMGVDTVTAQKTIAARRSLEAQRMATPKPKPAGTTTGDIVEQRRQANVKTLENEGVVVTPAMKKGGAAERQEEAQMSNPYWGQAVRDRRLGAVDGFIKATYNRALGAIGETFDGNDIARKGVKQVDQKLGAAYDEILPKVNFVEDETFVDGLDGLFKRAPTMGTPQADQFKAIVDNDLRGHLGPDRQLDGRQFKDIESDLSRQARDYKSSADPNQRKLGHALDDLNDLMRENVERNSDPGIRERLKQINNGWAMFTRIQDAAARRPKSLGRWTPTDLLQSVKKLDRSVRKGAFARGDALLQDWAEAGEDVIPDKMGDSFTAERAMRNGKGVVGGMLGAAVGSHVPIPGAMEAGVAVGAIADQHISKATNLAAKALMDHRAAVQSRAPQNYLARVSRATSPLVNHRIVGGANALRLLSQDPQQ